MKFTLYLTTLTAIGLSIHAAIGLPRHRRLLLPLALSIPVLKAMHLLLLNAQLSGNLTGIVDFSMFGWIWPLHQAQVITLTTASLLIVVGSLLDRVIIGLIGALGIAISFGLGGHAQGLEGVSIAPTLVAIHTAVAGFWFAAPITLFPRRMQSRETLSANLDAFSIIAIWLVPLIFMTGAVTVWLLIGSIEQILHESYGQLLLGKLFLATIALAIGAINRNHISDLIRLQPLKGKRLLALSLKAEAVLFAALLAFLVCATTLVGPDTG